MASSRGPLRRLGSSARARQSVARCGVPRAAWSISIAIAAGVALGVTRVAAQSSDDPIVIEYASRRTLSEGIGAWEGRLEAHLESGALTITPRALEAAVGADPAMARHVSLASRVREQGESCAFRTRSAELDLDLEAPVFCPSIASLDGEAIERPAFGGVVHVSPTIASDAVVPLRGHEYVATRGMVIDLAGVNVPAILLEASGRTEHPSESGVLVGHWSDSYWFDEDTGWVLRRELTEVVEGDVDAYEERELTWVVSAPFLRRRARSVVLEIHDCSDPRPPRGSAVWRVGVPVAGVALLGLVLTLIRKRFAGENT